tara:strand:- start:117 stop:1028 length:912 start_codon:yes stop_codon:yes gene_type:complete
MVTLLSIIAFLWLVWWDISHHNITFLLAFSVAQIPLIANLTLISYRSRWISGAEISFLVCLRGNSLAIISALLLPAKLGDLGKPSFFKAISHFPIAKGFSLVFEERIWDIVVLAILTMASIFFIGDISSKTDLINVGIFLVIVAFVGLGALILLPQFATRIPFLSGFEKKYTIFSRKLPHEILVSFLISLLAWVMSILILFFAYNLSGLPEIGLGQILLLFVMSTLGLVVSITPGGIGTYEGIIVAILVSNKVDWEAALAFAIFFRFCCLIIPGIIAAFALMNDGKIFLNGESKKNIKYKEIE